MFQMVDIRRCLCLKSIAQRERIVEAFIAIVSPGLPRCAGGGRRTHSRVSVSQPWLPVLYCARHGSFLFGEREGSCSMEIRIKLYHRVSRLKRKKFLHFHFSFVLKLDFVMQDFHPLSDGGKEWKWNCFCAMGLPV